MRYRLTGLAVSVVALLITGCGSSSGSSSSGSSGSGGTSVAMVLPGPINDHSFNQSGYDGLQQCKAQGLKTSYAEDVQPPNFVREFQTFARSNSVLFANGQQFGPIAAQVAPQYSKVKFVITSVSAKPGQPNVEAATVNSTQGAFLAGVVAGLATKTNKLGGVAGLQLPILVAQMKALEAGARLVNPKATLHVVYLGGFDDVGKGKEAAQSLASTGVDVIYQIADAAGVGVINGAAAAGIKAIGWGLDQHSLAPKTVIASELVNTTSEIGVLCKQIAQGQFRGGTVHIDGLRSGLIGLSRIYNLSPSVTKKVAEVKAEILAGKVTVPSIGDGVPASGPSAG